jgi:hypothetical protein
MNNKKILFWALLCGIIAMIWIWLMNKKKKSNTMSYYRQIFTAPDETTTKSTGEKLDQEQLECEERKKEINKNISDAKLKLSVKQNILKKCNKELSELNNTLKIALKERGSDIKIPSTF